MGGGDAENASSDHGLFKLVRRDCGLHWELEMGAISNVVAFEISLFSRNRKMRGTIARVPKAAAVLAHAWIKRFWCCWLTEITAARPSGASMSDADAPSPLLWLASDTG